MNWNIQCIPNLGPEASKLRDLQVALHNGSWVSSGIIFSEEDNLIARGWHGKVTLYAQESREGRIEMPKCKDSSEGLKISHRQYLWQALNEA